MDCNLREYDAFCCWVLFRGLPLEARRQMQMDTETMRINKTERVLTTTITNPVTSKPRMGPESLSERDWTILNK